MPDKNRPLISYKCFVCEKSFQVTDVKYNSKVNLPVCFICSNSLAEEQKAKTLLNDLADDFVCGCI